jgi:hypothetical protein
VGLGLQRTGAARSPRTQFICGGAAAALARAAGRRALGFNQYARTSLLARVCVDVVCAVAGLHHTAIFTREARTVADAGTQRGMDVIRYSLSLGPPPPSSADNLVRNRHKGGWVKVYRASAAAMQQRVKLRARLKCFAVASVVHGPIARTCGCCT